MGIMYPAVKRSEIARSLHRALLSLLCAGILLAGVELALVLHEGHDLWIYPFFPLAFCIYLGAGIVAWFRRPSNRMGPLILFGGLSLFAVGLGSLSDLTFNVVGSITATLPLAVLVHLLHAFPSGNLRGRTSLLTVLGAYATSIVLQAPLYLLPDEANTAKLIAHTVQGIAGVGVMLVTACVLVGRLRRAGSAQRRLLLPVYAYGAFAVIAISSSGRLQAVFHIPPVFLSSFQLLILTGVPIAFTLGVVRGGFAKTRDLEELGTWLGAAGGAKSTLAAALGWTLGDPSLELYFWVPESETFVDADGRATPIGSLPPHRVAVDIHLNDRLVGKIEYDSTLINDPEIVRSAGNVVAISLEGERFTAALLSSRHALLESRARLVDAADSERRRIARDLHDGLQMQLVLLALDAQQLANSPDSGSITSTDATELRKRIDAAASDLRQLVHELLPGGMSEGGLSAAVEDLADRMPIPTTLDFSFLDDALSRSVQSIAYFVISEGLTNIVKHSQAASAHVRLTHAHDVLLIEVSDDGIGGAELGRGTGIRGLSDRVDVLGGQITMNSVHGSGTQLLVEVPCA